MIERTNKLEHLFPNGSISYAVLAHVDSPHGTTLKAYKHMHVLLKPSHAAPTVYIAVFRFTKN